MCKQSLYLNPLIHLVLDTKNFPKRLVAESLVDHVLKRATEIKHWSMERLRHELDNVDTAREYTREDWERDCWEWFAEELQAEINHRTRQNRRERLYQAFTEGREARKVRTCKA